MFLLELIIIRKDERETDKLINQFAMTYYVFNDTEVRSKEIIIGNILCFNCCVIFVEIYLLCPYESMR